MKITKKLTIGLLMAAELTSLAFADQNNVSSLVFQDQEKQLDMLTRKTFDAYSASKSAKPVKVADADSKIEEMLERQVQSASDEKTRRHREETLRRSRETRAREVRSESDEAHRKNRRGKWLGAGLLAYSAGILGTSLIWPTAILGGLATFAGFAGFGFYQAIANKNPLGWIAGIAGTLLMTLPGLMSGMAELMLWGTLGAATGVIWGLGLLLISALANNNN